MSGDNCKASAWDEFRQQDLKVFAKLLRPELLSKAARRAGVPWGRGPLHMANLVWLALASALHTGKNFAAVLGLVLKLLYDAPGWVASPLAAQQRQGKRRAKRRHKHDPRGHDPTQLSEEAFVQARRKLPWTFWTTLILLLTEKFENEHGKYVRWKQFRLLTLDGTTIALDRWRRLTDHFGAARNGRGQPRTQARLVMLQLPLARLPWRYELTPLKDAERTVAARLLTDLRRDDLVLMDRGFWSYGLFWQIQQQQAFFAIRLVANVRLSKVRLLGRDDRLMRWKPADRRKKWRHLPEALPLRVIPYQIHGFRPTAVVTNLLDPKMVTREEWIRLAAVDEVGRVVEPGLYHRRWEIETTFFELKVTQNMEGTLRSRTPEGIRYEVAGHVLLYLLVRWLMVEAAEKAGVEDPLRLSFSGALQELDDMYQTLIAAEAEHVRRVLYPRLLERVASHQVPLRPGRHYPRPRDTKPKAKGKGRFQKTSKLETART
jgi:hypothetical protein